MKNHPEPAEIIMSKLNTDKQMLNALRQLVAEFELMNSARSDDEKLGDTPGMAFARAILAKADRK